MDIIQEGFKRCSKCGEVKPISDFNNCSSASDGLQGYCKECAKVYNAERYVKKKDEILKKKAEWCAKNKEKVKAQQAEWRAKHPTYDADYYKANKEMIDARIAEWQAEYYDPQTHPLNWAKRMVKDYRRMDRDRGFNEKETITAEWFLENIMYKPCAHCGLIQVGAIGVNRKSNELGHIPSNCEPCCKSCNSRQNCKDELERGLHVSCKNKNLS